MLRATDRAPAGHTPSPPGDRVVLDYDGRQRRRLAMTTAGGEDFLLDLPRPLNLRHGDGLLLEDGRVIAVEAAAEDLTAITGDDPLHMMRLAWHLGNRHLPTAVEAARLLIRPDTVIEAMIRGLGGHTEAVTAPFNPEGGAYSGGHSHD